MRPSLRPAALGRDVGRSALGALLLAAASAAEAARPPGGKVEPTPPVYDFVLDNSSLTLHDGVRLSVTYLKPRPRSEGELFPVLLDLYPYRKDEWAYDYPTYFARRGFITALVDIRGTGSSEGVLPPREYSEQELDDAVELIGLLSRLPQANGRVGMWGKSWGGFNAIQVAMRRPPALKAILAAEATDDLFHDDVHHMEGAFHLDQFVPFMDNEATSPQTPAYPLDQAYFENRFDQYPWFLTYAKNQRDGPFWRKNSLRWQYDRIDIPCYLVGGLLDGYRDSIPRMLENMEVPVRAALGPYKHDWPDEAVPGPGYEWRYEAVRWWDYWLKDHDTGILDDPPLWLFVREGHGPDADLQTTPGHWIGTRWPIPDTAWRSVYPSDHGRLDDRPGPPGAESLGYVATAGVRTGLWWGEPTGDMRPDDAFALVFDGPVVAKPLVIAGLPRVRLRVSADAPLAHWAVRLEDVQPDGSVALVAGGLLNGSQRKSRLEPEPLEPGKVYDLAFEMHFTTWTFRPGHRLRLAVSNSLWPMIWPTPSPMTTKLYLGVGATRVDLPVLPGAPYPAPAFRPPEPHEARDDVKTLDETGWPRGYYEWHKDLWSTKTTVEWKGHGQFETQGRHYRTWERNYYEANDVRPAEARFSGEAGRRIGLGERSLEIRSTLEVRSDEKNFYVTVARYLSENDVPLRRREWTETIPRVFN